MIQPTWVRNTQLHSVRHSHNSAGKIRAKLEKELRNRVVPVTTKPREAGEIDCVSYYYVDEDTFALELNQGKMIDYTTDDHGYLYGRPKPLIGMSLLDKDGEDDGQILTIDSLLPIDIK